jgi:primosomal protein N'
VRSLIGVKNKNILLNSYSSKLIPWIANHYFTPIHNALNLFFPKNLKEKIQKDTLQKDIGKNNIPLTYTSNYKLKLSEEQSKAYTQIQNSQNKKILLY